MYVINSSSINIITYVECISKSDIFICSVLQDLTQTLLGLKDIGLVYRYCNTEDRKVISLHFVNFINIRFSSTKAIFITARLM
jgi:hypothetical protein